MEVPAEKKIYTDISSEYVNILRYSTGNIHADGKAMKNTVHPHDEIRCESTIIEKWKLLIAVIVAVVTCLILIIIWLCFKLKPETTTVAPTWTVPLTTQVITTTEVLPPDGWSDWSSWSSCDVTCGQGYQFRNRTCVGNEACKGPHIQSKGCNPGFCTTDGIGVWTQWTGWSSCSVSCDGGTQERTRECKQDPGDEECPGPSSISRSCNSWKCPECDASCPSGGIWYDCSYCNCSGGLLRGKVESIYGVGIAHVQIYDTLLPELLLAETSNWGDFEIEDGCVGSELLFQPDEDNDYDVVEQVATVTTPNVTVTLVPKEKLKIVTPPESKSRLTGENTTLCCEAYGNPPVQFFQWKKDGLYIDMKEAIGNFSQLDLHHMQVKDTGYYSCEAINDEGTHTVYGQVVVKDTDDAFCQSIPQSKMTTLPPGCKYKGQSSVDVGTCVGNLCHTELSVEDDCQDSLTSCCGMVEYETIVAQCPGYTLRISLITKCGCVLDCA